MKADVLIVGAGFAGLTLAERLSNELGKHCLVVEKRSHLGGNAYDYKDAAGVLVHAYGSHCFHTNSDRIMEYLSKFTEWIPAVYTASSFTDGKLWSFPINLLTFEQMLGRESSTEEMEQYLAERKVPIEHPCNSEEAVISQVGWELYEKFYRGYVKKHWNRDPKQLDASVCSRVPIRTTRNALYFNDTYQCMPAKGYTAMFQNMLNPKIEVLLNTDYRDVQVEAKHTIYTGPIDEYFGYTYGQLPYRSVRFEHESFEGLKFWQPTFMVAYPNSEVFTRIIEMKHVTGQQCENTTIVRDYPQSSGEPMYPVPAPDTAKQYQNYKEMADQCKNVSFVGRLANYKYFDMHQVVAQALAEFERLRRVL